MIVSFRHKGLEELYKKGKSRKIDQHHWEKLLKQMSFLDFIKKYQRLKPVL